ncbi:tripartite tricarboxylate transporter TctB family protein [Cereibacter sphaeroides]|nr:tripartite tricarboxylate transporter TctB family protein [Cereibacter sphaeroides]
MSVQPDPESDRAREGSSDATPGGLPEFRRPGELAFAVFLALASAGLLFSAYDIAGFRALSSPGAIPMATTAAMLVTALLVLWKTARQPKTGDETLRIAVFPASVIAMAVLLIGYALLLKPLGFLPTSALFLFIAIKLLSGRSIVFTGVVTLASVIGIWLIFRIVFTVLMPAGIVPEAEIIQIFRDLFNGGA